MLHHIELYVSNLSASRAFWTDVLGFIGYQETANWEEGFTLGSEHDPYLTFVQVAPRYSERTFHRCGVGLNHIALRVSTREVVDTLRQHCLGKGYPCLYEDRYPFANGGTNYYALFVEDPDRIKVEFVAN